MKKPDAGWLIRKRKVTSILQKPSGSPGCLSFLTGHGIKAKPTNCKFAILICIALIARRGTEFNRRINLFRGLGRFNLELALIGFRTTGALGFLSHMIIASNKG